MKLMGGIFTLILFFDPMMLNSLRMIRKNPDQVDTKYMVTSHCNLCEGKEAVFLTFDDGPITVEHAKKLAELKVHATYFWLGKNLNTSKESWNQIRELGHAIGSHTWSHHHLSEKPELAEKDATYVKKEILDSKALIEEKTGSPVTLLRMPYGDPVPSGSLAQSIKQNYQRVIQWDIATDDWKGSTNLEINQQIKKQWKSGQHGHIILMHEWSKAGSVNQVEKTVKYIRELCPKCEFLNIEEGCGCDSHKMSSFKVEVSEAALQDRSEPPTI
eukprot:gnl/MRDRNA2_/MRDRNA2_150578_c0_seq1.p1 gnl/MRDRNA2_/MRDRNA2_150578_c0~~gnl/MRDRNA2_/MRDRNA2_150578_c0_seq1.p1  ORF type:complete len:272 (+),score=49.95 gnl/MRDRNA2_/MRDRNA2_150578_c0_seq1:76-891(+)